MSVSVSRAYPFALLGAPLVPLFASLFLGETTSAYLLGGIIVVAGLYVISAQGTAAKAQATAAEAKDQRP